MPIPPMRRAAVAAASALAVALFAAGCGDDDGNGMGHGNMGGDATSSATSKPSGANFNATDVTFATDMIPHHRQALEMSQVAESRATNAQVKELAGRISKAQQPEITTMSGWLTAWGEPVPSAGNGHGGMPGMGNMPGMMTDDEMKQLNTATGKDFDRMFLEMMIRHHQGAIEMAKTEQQQGTNPDAKKLAGSIATSQTAEVTEMQALLTKV